MVRNNIAFRQLHVFDRIQYFFININNEYFINKISIVGSYNCRVGWATEKEPQLIFKNLIAKPRKERGKKDGEPQVGNDIANIEAVRFQLKTQFDRNVVTHFEAQEQIFDYTFTHMGIDTEGSVNHPIILTEAFLNPNYSRNCKFLFEYLILT